MTPHRRTTTRQNDAKPGLWKGHTMRHVNTSTALPPITAGASGPGRRPRRRWLAVPLVATALLAASCGGSSNNSSNNGGDGGTDGVDADSEFVANMPPCPADALAKATAPVNITVWQPYNAKPKEGFENLVAQYNASQSKVVVNNQNQGTYDEIWNKYLSAAASKSLPNLAFLEDVQFQAVAESGTVLPAQSCIDAEGTDTSTWMKSAVSYYSIDGALVPASANLSSPIMYYNKNHFRAAGLDPDKTPGTLAEVREYAQKLKDGKVTDKPLVLYLHPWFIDTWLAGADSPVVNNDNGHGPGTTDQSTFASDASTELYTWIQEMYNAGLVNAIPYDGKTIDHYLAMQSQSGSMMFETSTAAVSIKALLAGDTINTGSETVINTSALDVGAGPMPGLNAPGQVMIGGGAFYMTATGTPEQQAATWDFMKWWNTAAVQAQWNILGAYIPFNQDAVTDPSVIAYWNDDLAGRWLKISYDQLAAIPLDNTGPVMGPFQQYRDALRDTTASLVLAAVPPADAIATVVSATDKALADYNAGGF